MADPFSLIKDSDQCLNILESFRISKLVVLQYGNENKFYFVEERERWLDKCKKKKKHVKSVFFKTHSVHFTPFLDNHSFVFIAIYGKFFFYYTFILNS